MVICNGAGLAVGVGETISTALPCIAQAVIAMDSRVSRIHTQRMEFFFMVILLWRLKIYSMLIQVVTFQYTRKAVSRRQDKVYSGHRPFKYWHRFPHPLTLIKYTYSHDDYYR